MLVSILIPCFNAVRWVRQAVESALAQSHSPREIIIVDDGSTDGSLDVIKSFGDSIRWETGPNRGGNAARNRLLELARGTWVQYLDADDYLLPGKIADQAAVLQRHPHADIIFGPVTIEWTGEGGASRTVEAIPEPHDPWMLLALWKLPQTGAPLWRKHAIIDVGGWRADQPCCQEHELYLRLLMAGKHFQYAQASGAIYRRFSGGTVSTRNMAMVRRERAKIEQQIEDHLRQAGQLTSERLWAVNQARFEMARSAWTENTAEAHEIHATILSNGRRFYPKGISAPPAYRLAYGLLGFEAAERIAAARRILGNVSRRRLN